jgi:hypothetical protein
MQMGRSWIRKGVRRLSSEHTKGVEDFMQFVRRSVPCDADVLCPCCHCLNRENQPLGKVEDHLLLYGMASTYDRWIHHGEALYAEPEPDAEAHHHVEDGPQQEDAGFEE